MLRRDRRFPYSTDPGQALRDPPANSEAIAKKIRCAKE